MKLRLLGSLLLLSATAFAQTSSFDWTAVEAALGRKGSMQPGEVYKFGLPRTDLQVTVNGLAVKPPLALGGWLAFKGTGAECMMMGDLVVSENEVAAVIHAALPHQIQITAIHNHVLDETPRVMYMHVGGHFSMADRGSVCAVTLAKAMKDVLAAAHVPAASTAPAPAAAALDFDQSAIEKTLQAKGKINGGVLQFAIPRSADIKMHGMVVPPSMGTATAINFQPVDNQRAAITGDFVMVGDEVNNVLRVLHEGDIMVTALHSHMLDEEPRLFFMHFWAVDDAAKLAGTLRKALDQMNVSQPGADKTPLSKKPPSK